MATLLLAGILATAPTAGAQSAADQYIPELDRGGASPDDPGGGGLADPASPSSGQAGSAPDAPKQAKQPIRPEKESGSGGGGEIPGSDRPVTPFVWILGGLLLLGLLARLLLKRGVKPARAP